ncbi:MAG: hypothetical protein Q8L53_09595 [Aestuariivirga sp.]|nr:hypothetical protein [Aestuariivirga sp.]
MFVHKSMPLALSFAATMVIGLSAGPAQADRQQDSYCSAPEVCNQRQIGIIQKERDGVNYFYGGSDVPPPQVNYIYLRDDTVDQPVNISNVNTTNFAAPRYTHLFRKKKDHWKKKHHPGPFDLPGLNLGKKFTAP